MVTSVNTSDVTAILNSKTSHVADLKKKFTLGSIGYNLFKLFSCFLSNSNPTKQAINKAETIDKMPAQIKKTAEKIVKVLKQEEFSPAIIDNRAELLMPKEDALKMSAATVKGVKHTNQLQDLMGTFTSQAQKLSSAYGHNVASTGAYVDALSALVKKEGLYEISGQNFMQLSAIQSQTKAFAQQGIGAVAAGLEGFINELKSAFPNVDRDFITTHVYRQLCESGVANEVEAYVATYSPEKAEKLAETENKPERAQIDEILKNFKIFKDEIEELRGPNHMNGSVHRAWINYMKECCRYALKANDYTAEAHKLSTAQVDMLKRYINAPTTHQDELKEMEGPLNEIFTKEGFARKEIPVLLLSEKNANKECQAVLEATTQLGYIGSDVDNAFKQYKALDDRLKELRTQQATEFTQKTVKAGDIEITSVMNTDTAKAIQDVVNKMDAKAQEVARNFADKTAQAQSLETKLAFAKENLFPSYARRAEDNYPFAQFASNVASI